MRDLKQRLFDLLRSGGNNNNHHNNNSGNNNHGVPHTQHSQIPAQKPKKLHEYTAADCNAAFLRKYHDLSISRDVRDKERERERERAAPAHSHSHGHGPAPNVIYFNENLSMASKYNVQPFPPLTRYPSCPLSSFGAPGAVTIEGGSAGSSLGEEEEELDAEAEAEDTESEAYNFCSDEDDAQTLKLRHHRHGMDLELSSNHNLAGMGIGIGDEDEDQAESQLDSFCTLCTSTFSYNKCCRFCDNSLCGSKCNSERGSHASRLSRISQMSRVLGQESSPNPGAEFEQPHPRFGGSMRMLAAHHPAPAALR
ncbi:hypothetical protein KR018_001602 [Drosophila ironensis]|nr:hypothetical protein KR018_001602 [Drosophila ironensis]